MALAQWLFGGSSPSVRQLSKLPGSNAPGRTAWLKSRTAVFNALESRPKAPASSPMDLASSGGKTEGMKCGNALGIDD